MPGMASAPGTVNQPININHKPDCLNISYSMNASIYLSPQYLLFLNEQQQQA